jgi:hypothetical protein
MAEGKKASNGLIAGVAVGIVLFLALVWYFVIRKPTTTTVQTRTNQNNGNNNQLGAAASIIGSLSGLGSSIAGAAGSSHVPQSGTDAGYTVIINNGQVFDGQTLIGTDNGDGLTYTDLGGNVQDLY